MASKYKLLLIPIITLIAIGCKKNLEKKPNSNLQVPTTPDELQGLLDNQDVFLLGHTLGLMCADEFYVSSDFYYRNLSPTQQNAYVWKPDLFGPDETPYDWTKAYEQIYYSNIALEGILPQTSSVNNDLDLNKIKGDALFKRALSHFHLLELFSPAYDAATAGTDPGIPLKLKADIWEDIKRSSLKICFEKVLSDLHEAKALLPDKPESFYKNRASKAAVLALSARIHLYMGSWQQSASDAEAALTFYDSLINFNLLDTNATRPIKPDNMEIIYSMKLPDINDISPLVVPLAGTKEGANVDTSLIYSFTSEDLRFPIFYRHRNDKTWGLKFTLTGTRTPFAGLCTSEIYLTLAEAQARQGNEGSALTTLKKLLINRYVTGQVPPLPNTSDSKAVLERILSERRKEMAFRATRWMDIKRLNKLAPTITQTRKIEGTLYSIAPNDVRYSLPLPPPLVKKYGF